MKALLTIIAVVSTALSSSGQDQSPSPTGGVKAEYFGQAPPKLRPEVLGRGILSTKESELNCAFTPDGDEVYFTVVRKGRYTLMTIKRERGVWGERAVAPFSGTYGDVDPFVTMDGKRLYFSSTRPIDGVGPAKDSNIWYVERTKDGSWSAPSCEGIPNTPGKDDYYTSVTLDGTLYTSIFDSNLRANIYRSPLKGGHHLPFERVENGISSEHLDHDPYVAPDESYLIFTSERPGGRGGKDLYISFRQSAGGWAQPQNMGSSINTSGYEWCPMLSPDGRYLLFTRDGDIHWVDAALIETLRPRDTDEPVRKLR